MRRPAISPHDPKLVMLGCDMTGAYITTDGGASWRMFNLGSIADRVRLRSESPATLYAGAEGVYKSEDAGRSWRLVLPDPAQNTPSARSATTATACSSPTTPPTRAADGA